MTKKLQLFLKEIVNIKEIIFFYFSKQRGLRVIYGNKVERDPELPFFKKLFSILVMTNFSGLSFTKED